ncbi:DUF3352 domain-containing protein [Plebeiibacterium sediminum]|uniref:DUF3352 domain-containing protein n=1 Tax=Plebeiibacterium sediminum TaxID=2992112 RepID=A0AAE3SH25_9BACT|nr:DUF3352 domain-containing protein [Plebeiobacterium sediminum]MCW3789120.1 DUF3352 domain-containing protein [Plebeiobacterium sediminum]
MKLFLKFIGYFILGFIIIIIGVILYFQLGTKDNNRPITMVPSDALVTLETDNLSETVMDITETNYWKSIIESNVLKDFKEALISYEESIEKNKWLKPILKKQSVTFSLHALHQNKLDYLVITDIKKYGRLDIIPKLSSILKIPTRENTIDSTKVFSIYLKDYDLNLHLATVQNLLLCSSSYQLLEKTLKKEETLSSHELEKRKEVNQTYASDLFNIYTNNNLIQKYFAQYSSSFFKGLAFSALGADFSESSFSLEGYSSIYDTIASPFLSIKNTTAEKRNTEAVIPSNISWYLNFNVTDFTGFYNHFLNQYAKINPIGFQTYSVGIRLTESYMGIDIEKNILSWLSGEIAIAQFKPLPNAHKDDFLVVVAANDMDDAKTNLDDISKKIKNRTSFKYKQIHYKNYEINYLNIKGFFKLFMGGFLLDRSKPYYTIINYYILFSNSSDILEQCIDNYLIGNTLERNKDFQVFMENFKSESQITSFVNMPRLYDRLYYFGTSQERKNIDDYRKIIQNMGWVGFQLYPENELLKTKIHTLSTESPDENYQIDLNLHSAEDLFIDEFEHLDFKIDLGEEYNNFDGDLAYYLTHPERVQDSVLVHEGNLDEGVLEGMWRSFYTSGNIKSAVNYDDGEVNGTAVFYYDNPNHIIRAEVDFEENLINGVYKEFYTNGNIKASIEFNDGERNGDVFYYYRNTQIKTEGQFKKGKQTGKWKYYSKSGELINKENW